MKQASLLVWAPGGFTSEYDVLYTCQNANESTNVTVPELSHCVWATGGEWVEVAASGYWELYRGIQRHCDVALQLFTSLLSHLLRSAVIHCALSE